MADPDIFDEFNVNFLKTFIYNTRPQFSWHASAVTSDEVLPDWRHVALNYWAPTERFNDFSAVHFHWENIILIMK